MGETLSTTIGDKDKIEKFMQKLVFVQQMEDEQFGSIEVYRLKEPPYEYIMDYKRTFIEGDVRYVKYMESMRQLAKTEHKNLAKIHLTELRQGIFLLSKETQMCIKDKKTHTFCNYYNFNLVEAIKKKKQQQSIFTESELVYIMGCLLEVGEYLQNFNISIGDYRAQNIFLSPEGYVKLYLLEVDEENRHSCYFKVLAEKDSLQQYLLSPEQLHHLSLMTYQPDYDLAKSDLFSISLLLFQLITQDDIKFYFNDSKTSYKFDRIHFDLDAIQKIYSLPFLQLLKSCLAQNPQHRPTFQEAISLLNIIKKNSPQSTYCIRLHDDEGKKKLNHRKSTLQNSPKAPLLSHVTGKLMPSPITTLSSSNSSSFRATQSPNFPESSQPSQNFASLKKSPSLSSKTSQNQTQPGLMEKFVQKKVIYFQK